MTEVQQKGKAAKKASFLLTGVTTEEKNAALHVIADQLITDQATILQENEKDIHTGKAKRLTEAVLDRIMLNETRIKDMATAIKQVAALEDPVGQLLETIEKDNGLQIEKRRVPIGVIGMIYEARPNVTIDAAALTLKTGNAVMLRGSSSATFSNIALVQSIHRALEKSALPVDGVQLIEDTNRETAKAFFQLNDYLDVLIPRGGKNLIDTVVRESTVPVIETGAGNCHIFIEATAQKEMAEEIVLNAKLQRPSVCNAIESILIQSKWFEQYGFEFLTKLYESNLEIYGDESVCEMFPQANPATEADWGREYLGLTVSVKVVENNEEAIAHINTFGTRHSEAIITEDDQQAVIFLQQVDATAVYHNASTRFTDGFEFGYGAEIGISTQKLHARGPMGLPALTSSKFFIRGNGQIRN
ncbi:glutamate-5-semialdehyde dehydrogenase [Virgibacillus sp. NKC19-3]|uniref:glutamate-5-semialdehyde dehydrogenase n=1 Tax=Virgibacillus saliphilus TaxID=2831674 RepID=UPI001C9B5E12|nr:glutamate-5-semialdehyde dehydrogenase [Virgibacillus sp. NKC19-3]MBY7142804.1 glutamate-5-semialdehyde dehydrogenase [Virgibacillus sp. NKC19-3]